MSLYQHIAVEKVEFVDEDYNPYKQDYILKLNIGEEFETQIKILPELASNKNVNYSSTNEQVCSINEEGVIIGLDFGTSIIMVKTEEGSKYSKLIVKVTQDNVSGVNFTCEEIELNIGETKILTAEVDPHVALNKKIIYSSSNPEIVTIDSNGIITALSAGEATITATTDDGGYTDTCLVTVLLGVPALWFDVSSNPDLHYTPNGYITSLKEIDLLNYLQIDEERVIINEVKLRIRSGGDIAKLTHGKLTITGKGIVSVVAFIGEQENPTHQTELKLMCL
jgi:hypothetical protein